MGKCNCISNIEKETEEKYQADLASFEHFGKSSAVSYHPYTLDGKPSKHRGHISVKWRYCPFCGRKIDY